jgi:hypothetical protein
MRLACKASTVACTWGFPSSERNVTVKIATSSVAEVPEKTVS